MRSSNTALTLLSLSFAVLLGSQAVAQSFELRGTLTHFGDPSVEPNREADAIVEGMRQRGQNEETLERNRLDLRTQLERARRDIVEEATLTAVVGDGYAYLASPAVNLKVGITHSRRLTTGGATIDRGYLASFVSVKEGDSLDLGGGDSVRLVLTGSTGSGLTLIQERRSGQNTVREYSVSGREGRVDERVVATWVEGSSLPSTVEVRRRFLDGPWKTSFTFERSAPERITIVRHLPQGPASRLELELVSESPAPAEIPWSLVVNPGDRVMDTRDGGEPAHYRWTGSLPTEPGGPTASTSGQSWVWLAAGLGLLSVGVVARGRKKVTGP